MFAARSKSTSPIAGSVASASRTTSPIIRHSDVPATSGSATATSSAACSSASWGACIAAGLVGGEGFAVDASLIQADVNKHLARSWVRSGTGYRSVSRHVARSKSIWPRAIRTRNEQAAVKKKAAAAVTYCSAERALPAHRGSCCSSSFRSNCVSSQSSSTATSRFSRSGDASASSRNPRGGVGRINGPVQTAVACSSASRNSRRLPGQSCRCKSASVSSARVRGRFAAARKFRPGPVDRRAGSARGHCNLEDVQTVKQILPEPPCAHLRPGGPCWLR